MQNTSVLVMRTCDKFQVLLSLAEMVDLHPPKKNIFVSVKKNQRSFVLLLFHRSFSMLKRTSEMYHPRGNNYRCN